VEISKQLVRELADGDISAFQKIFRAGASDVYWLAYRILGRKEAAEDVVQETFMKIYNIRQQLDPERPFHALVLRIATNAAIDLLRKSQREDLMAEPSRAHSMSEGGPYGEAIDLEMGDRKIDIEGALNDIPPLYQVVLVLKYNHDLSYQEIAETLGISVPAVALRLKRGKERLRERLSEGSRR
jgi:RNA polymerase sigma-70 factor (ECF subfamily)